MKSKCRLPVNAPAIRFCCLHAREAGCAKFAAAQHVDYRVALGLRDGIEVDYSSDTLAQGDTIWASSPMALVGAPILLAASSADGKIVIAAPEGAKTGGKEAMDSKVVIGEPADNRFEVFSQFDYGFYDQDALSHLFQGFDSDSYAGSIGLEYRLLPWLNIGGAFTYLQSDTDLDANLGSIDLDGTLLSAYFTAFWRQFYLDVLYSYSNFDNETARNTLLGNFAHGETDSHSHNIDINLGRNFRVSDQVQVGPFAGLNYATGGIDGYVERGGANANLEYPDDNFESMIGRLGGQLSYTTRTPAGRLTVQGRAGWAHEFLPEADTVQADLVNSLFALVTGNHAQSFGSFAAEANGAHPGTDWLELGAGMRLDLDGGWNVQLDYQNQLARNNAAAHFAALKVGFEW